MFEDFFTTTKEQPVPIVVPPPNPSNVDLYANQLIEVLSDAVDILNEAKLDGHILQFQINQIAPDGRYALTSLTATRPIALPQPANDSVETH